ncbi:MAG: hypothetical protein R6W78_03410 [Bacteroidales bacterium]
MKMRIFFIAAIILSSLVCCTNKKNEKQTAAFSSVSETTGIVSGSVLADTIIYDVIIKNVNPDDIWTRDCLKGLKREIFIDQLFESVYNGSMSAYAMENNVLITPAELKEMERNKTIERNNIGKIQFTEAWLFNDSLMSMSKKVISVSLGSEVFDNGGELLGYKHVFKLNFN